ncbi:MAG: hypothetical protein AAF434_13230 [Pseudomonadota bacterium]
MITRYAIFSGTVKQGMQAEMRAYVHTELTPLWRQFSGAEEVRVLFGVEQDANGPAIPLVLAITYADTAAMERGLASPARYQSRDLLPAFYERFFEKVELWHYVMSVD